MKFKQLKNVISSAQLLFCKSKQNLIWDDYKYLVYDNENFNNLIYIMNFSRKPFEEVPFTENIDNLEVIKIKGSYGLQVYLLDPDGKYDKIRNEIMKKIYLN